MSTSGEPGGPTVVMVTGASRGVGRETAITLDRAGYRVVAASRNPPSGLAAGIQAVAVDIRSAEAVDAAIDAVIDAHGRLDVLVNVAGVTRASPIELEREDAVGDILDTNVVGALRMARAALPAMRRRGRGLILNVSSQSAHLRSPFFAAYGASKAALEHLTLSLDAEVRDLGIRAGLIVLGAVNTGILDRAVASVAHQPYSAAYEVQVERARAAIAGGADPAVAAAGIVDVVERFDAGQFSTRTAIGADAAWAIDNGNVWPRPGRQR